MAEIYFTYTIEPGAKVLKWKINQTQEPAPEPQFVNFPKCDNLDAIEWNKLVEIDGNEPNVNLNFPPPAKGENLQQIVIVGTSTNGINLTLNSSGENFVCEDGSALENPFFYDVPSGGDFIVIATYNETSNNILITVKEFPILEY